MIDTSRFQSRQLEVCGRCLHHDNVCDDDLHLYGVIELQPVSRLHVAGLPEAGHVAAGDDALVERVGVMLETHARVFPLRVVARAVAGLAKYMVYNETRSMRFETASQAVACSESRQ